MNNISKSPLILAGFIGGISLMVSCGGGHSNSAIASSVQDQLFCERRVSTLINDAFVGVVSEVNESLNCIDSSGNTYYRTDLLKLYNQGWRVQLITANKEYVFSK